MRARSAPSRPPPWHRSRLGWVNALGFALTLFLALWLFLAVLANFLPKADPVRFPIPLPFVLILSLTQLTTIALGATVVLRFMWRGADFTTHLPRLYVFFWTCAGLLFFLCQVVILTRFGMVNLPNAARWAEHIYWGVSPIGLATFALMAYVNVELPGAHDPYDDEEYEEHYEDEFDEHYDDVDVDVDAP